MATTEVLERGRESFARAAWADAFAQLSAADEEGGLGAEDLERLAVAAYLTGRDEESQDAWARAHHAFSDEGEVERGVRCAFWLGVTLMLRGEMAQGGGWFARAHRILDEHDLDCVERGYLLVPVGLQQLGEGDPATARETFGRAIALGSRFGDTDLIAFGRLGVGQALIPLGETTEAANALDETMVAATSGELSPLVAGIAYCAVIIACQEMFDVRRAREWTSALSRWCESQPDLVPYRGQCLVHRSQIMQLRGDWGEALDEAQRAHERFADPPGQPAMGMALYQLAELHRLRGRFSEAEASYREANRCGHDPQPGLALLRLAEGRVDAAEAAIRRVVDEARDPLTRSRMLPAYVEIMLAADDVEAARAGADELSAIADDVEAPLLQAASAHATGAVLLAEGDDRGAGRASHRAWEAWQELEAPYEAACARVLIGLSNRELGDLDGAQMELDAARSVFEVLGATPDLDRVDGLTGEAAASPVPGGLTEREVEVLRLVATGKTNRAIADELVISEKTVARHLSNIFAKMGVSSRAAATAYAYEHDLV